MLIELVLALSLEAYCLALTKSRNEPLLLTMQDLCNCSVLTDSVKLPAMHLFDTLQLRLQ